MRAALVRALAVVGATFLLAPAQALGWLLLSLPAGLDLYAALLSAWVCACLVFWGGGFLALFVTLRGWSS